MTDESIDELGIVAVAEKTKAYDGRSKGWSNLKPIKPGECRNPTGRPKAPQGFIESCKKWYTTKGIAVLKEIAEDKTKKASDRIKAIAEIGDRCLPKQIQLTETNSQIESILAVADTDDLRLIAELQQRLLARAALQQEQNTVDAEYTVSEDKSVESVDD